jgi:hypothetical protein
MSEVSVEEDELLLQQVVDQIEYDLTRIDKNKNHRIRFSSLGEGFGRSIGSPLRRCCLTCQSRIHINRQTCRMICNTFLDPRHALARLAVSWRSLREEQAFASRQVTADTEATEELVDQFDFLVRIANRCVPCNRRLTCSIQARLHTEWRLEPA